MKITILGCGSAQPNIQFFNSSQVLSIGEKNFMIDCGEGTQIRLRQFKVKTARLNHIFISHLHGDHCFGLIGIISSFQMLGRTADLHIHAHADLEKLLQAHIDYFCKEISFRVFFHSINPRTHALIFEDRTIRVYSIPLKHRVPTCGFLFEEKEKDRHLIKERIDFYHIPVKELQHIKKGADFITSDRQVISNALLTRPADAPKRYAYCADTSYSEKIIPIIEGVDCLYHEATFEADDAKRAKDTCHSTAEDAANIALKAGAKQLLMGHYSARYYNHDKILTQAKAIFPNAFICKDGDCFEF